MSEIQSVVAGPSGASAHLNVARQYKGRIDCRLIRK